MNGCCCQQPDLTDAQVVPSPPAEGEVSLDVTQSLLRTEQGPIALAEDVPQKFPPVPSLSQDWQAVQKGDDQKFSLPTAEKQEKEDDQAKGKEDASTKDEEESEQGEDSVELSDFERKFKARQTLDAACVSSDVGSLRKALQAADKAGLDASETAMAEAMLDGKKNLTRKSLAAAQCGADLRVALRDAEAAGLDAQELQAAKGKLSEKQASTRKSLVAALNTPGNGDLRVLVRNAEDVGLDSSEIDSAKAELEARKQRKASSGQKDEEAEEEDGPRRRVSSLRLNGRPPPQWELNGRKSVKFSSD